MTDLLTEDEYEAFKNTTPGETVAVETMGGATYSVQVTDRQGATLIGVGGHNGNPVVVELRGGRGRDDDDEQPFIALGIGGPDQIETTDTAVGTTHIRGIGSVKLHRESGSVSYDEEVASFDCLGEATLQLG